MFTTMSQENVRAIAMKVIEGGSTMRDMPSFGEVMAMQDMKVEVLS